MSPKAYIIVIGLFVVMWIGMLLSFGLVSTKGKAATADTDSSTGNSELMGLVMGWAFPVMLIVFGCLFFFYRANAAMMQQIIMAVLFLVLLPTAITSIGLSMVQLGGVRDTVAASTQSSAS